MKPSLRQSEDHAWQSGRWIAALDTGHFVPDERSLADLASRATAYARLLTDYDGGNRPHLPPTPGATDDVGAWESFFRDDVTFLLAEMAAVDALEELPDAAMLRLITQA